MTFTPNTSRSVQTNPNTKAGLRTTLALLARSLDADRIDIDALTDAVALLQKAFKQTAIADVAIAAGDVLRKTTAGHVGLADATALSTSDVCGVAIEPANSGGTVTYTPLGMVSIEGWGLTEGADYWLSGATAGAIVTAPDQTGEGNVALRVGQAYASTDLLVNFGDPHVY